MALAGREKSMGFVWFLIGALLIGSVLWIAYDETIGRRTWKKYAAEWTEMESARLNEAIQKQQDKIDPEKLKKIQMEREDVKAFLQSDDYKKAQEELAQVKTNYDDAKQQLQFTKADLDETFYRWKHALHEGHEYEQYQKQYEALDKQVEEYKKLEAEWEAKYLAAKEKVEGYDSKLADLDSQEAKLYEKITPLQRQLEAVQKRGAPIEQVVLDDLGKAGSTKWGTVDRCVSCHIPIMTPGHEKNENPFKTHPNLEKIFDAHPYESYGCTTCHGGQGRATQIKHHPMEKGDYPHGFDKYWLNPLLRGDFVEASCNKCHVQQFVLDMAPVYSQGKEIFVEYGCINCHKINGLEWAPKSGPDLTRIKEKVYPEWLVAWAKKPTNYLPHTKMPQVPWANDDEVVQAAAYILAKSEPFNWKYGKFPGGGSPAEGEKLFNSVGCFACHNIGGKGGTAGPALDRISEKTSADWIWNWIQEPKNWSEHARMPSLRLSNQEARDLTAYLATMGSPLPRDESLRTALMEEKNVEAGFKVISTYGCYACHNIDGFESMGRPSVDLTNFGRKDVHELAFGDAKIPETWDAWTLGKITNPQMFLDERSSSVMPKPNLTDEQRHAMVVFLKGQAPEDLPAERIAFDPVVEKGRHLVYRYNCKQCHVIEGQGGKVAEWITEPNYLPPNLASTGARLQTAWMYQFLKNPASFPKIRDWLEIRMPTFGFTDAEADELVQYFKRIAGVDTLLEGNPHLEATPEELAAGKELVSTDNFACGSCHIINGVRPAAGPTVWAPDLAYGHHRLRPQWINKWVRDPAKLVPGIRMPGYYPEGSQGPAGIFGGDVDRQVQALVDYVVSLGNPESVTVKGRMETVPEVEASNTGEGSTDTPEPAAQETKTETQESPPNQ